MTRSVVRRILGLDPGLATTGYGLIDQNSNRISLVTFNCFYTSPNKSFAERLKQIYQELDEIIKQYRPNQIAIEKIFFAKNVKTALEVSQARGVLLLAAIQNNIPIEEFTPLQIKQALTGYGRADKTQIQKMVKTILGLKAIPKPDDAADALACALCSAFSKKF